MNAGRIVQGAIFGCVVFILIVGFGIAVVVQYRLGSTETELPTTTDLVCPQHGTVIRGGTK